MSPAAETLFGSLCFRADVPVPFRADHVSAFKTKVEQREARLKAREREVSEREATLVDRERQFEQETRVARTEYEAFLLSKDQFEAERKQWQNERAKEQRQQLGATGHGLVPSSAAESSASASVTAEWQRASLSSDTPESSRRGEHGTFCPRF